MLRYVILISAMIFLCAAGLKAQTTFECENHFYLSEHRLDSVNELTNLYNVTWENNVLDFDLFAQYTTTCNSIALNPLDGLIYGFNLFTQEIIRLHTDGTFNNLGKVAGLDDLGFFHSGGTFDDLGRYIITGHNQFISMIDVSCDTPILIQQVERFNDDPFVQVTFFSDIAFHPTNGLLYGYIQRLVIRPGLALEEAIVYF